jgi:hypothetical protein
MKLWRLPKIEGSILKYRVPPLWLSYIGERNTTAKAYGIKVRYYGEHVGDHIGDLVNLVGTHWELKRNIVGTHWEPGKMEKNTSPLPPTSTPQKL